jgi:protein-tyrosine-phosphatase
MAEALFRHIGGEHLESFNAGVHLDGAVHPQALETLRHNHVPVDGRATKDVSTFDGQTFDFTISLCAGRERSPRLFRAPTHDLLVVSRSGGAGRAERTGEDV